MNVLSLFGGIEVARQAFKDLNHLVGKYYSSEINPNAIKVSTFNHKDIIHLGDITKLDMDYLKTLDIDFIIFGSPCQDFSTLGKTEGMVTEAYQDITSLTQYLNYKAKKVQLIGSSYLFWEAINILHTLKPTYFLMENVKVSNYWLKLINKALNSEALFIDSNTVSAQNRPRYYWTNLSYNYPEKLNTDVIRDILDENSRFTSEIPKWLQNTWTGANKARFHQLRTITQKANCLNATLSKGNIASYCKLGKDLLHIKKYSINEIERLQTLPIGYVDNVTNVATSRGKDLIGNSFTLEVIKNFLKSIK